MKRLRAIVVLLVSIHLGQSWPANAQQCTPEGQYVVTNQAQLLAALQCVASNCTGACTACLQGCPGEIIVPAGTSILIDTQLDIESVHNGLTLTIDGVLTWIGAPDENGKIIFLNGASDITIRGAGYITSVYIPTSTNRSINGIQADGVSNITIEGLTCTNLESMFVSNNAPSSGMTFKNLTTPNLRGYGIIIDATDPFTENILITNCHVNGSVAQHGFRIWANNVTVLNCSAYNTWSSGMWILEGQDVLIDGFLSNKNIRIGPNPSFPDQGDRLRCVQVYNVTTTFDLPTGGVEIHPGTLGCYLENITSGSYVTAHLGPGGVLRPHDRLHWRNVSPGVSLQRHEMMCSDIGSCMGDVNDDGMVNVADCLAVISAWGICPPFGDASQCHLCLADVYPLPCGDAHVDANDLLAVLNDWGCTNIIIGPAANAPQAIRDCWRRAVDRLGSTTGEQWLAELAACIDSLGAVDAGQE